MRLHVQVRWWAGTQPGNTTATTPKNTKRRPISRINSAQPRPRNWRLTAPWHGAKIMVPAKFMAGEKDIGVESFGVKNYIKSGGFKSNVPDLEVAIIEGHHFLQQEQAERVNAEILSFLDKFTEN